MEVLWRCPLAIAQRLVHCAIAVSTAVLDRVTKTMSVALLLTNNLDNSKQKTSNMLSPAPPPYSWSPLGKVEGPAPPPSSKISWSFDLAWNPVPASVREKTNKANKQTNKKHRFSKNPSTIRYRKYFHSSPFNCRLWFTEWFTPKICTCFALSY